GSIASKPAASVANKPPTGGATTSVKLAKELGDPAKPGFAPGDYVIDIETGTSPDADVSVHAYVTLTVDSAFKCTVHPADTSGNMGAGQCGDTGQPLCAPEAPGKCVFTTFQAAGIPNYTLGPGDGQPTASRTRIRTANLATCKTGDITLLGNPVPPS